MDIQDIENTFNTRNEVIIKKKKCVLNLSIKCGIIKHNVNIYADSEKLCVGNKTIKMSHLRRIFILAWHSRAGFTYRLEIQGKGMIEAKSLIITGISSEDVEKINQLFEYFIFSNEKNLEKLNSDEYIPLIDTYIEELEFNAKKYEKADSIIETNNNDILLNNKYYLYKILPKEYSKKYKKKKEYLIYESKFVNNSYIEIWIKKNEYEKLIGKHIFSTIIIQIFLCSIIFIVTFIGIGKFFDLLIRIFSIFYKKEDITYQFFHTVIWPIIYCCIYSFLFIIFMCRKDKKKIKKFFVCLILTLFIILFSDISIPYKYSELIIDNKPIYTIGMLKYKQYLVKDIINKNSKVINVNNINEIRHISGSGGYISNTYISFTPIEDNNYKTCVIEEPEVIDFIESLLEYKDIIQIEYYSNSGIIKTIDGIDKSEYDKLETYILKCKTIWEEEQNKKAQEKLVEEQKKEKELEKKRELDKIKNEINSNVIGEKFVDIEEQLKINNITNYSIEYISSKIYNIETIAFYEGIKDIYYIVKDNNKEDMLKMPKLKLGMTKDEIINVLQESGFKNYECDSINWDLRESGTLHSCKYAEGTLLPKQTVICFSIEE